MAIIRLEDKYKSKYKIQLTPERHYVSSSSGITGSVHVFPNRSETQKDNIDERLNLAPMVEEGTEFSGKPIRAYDSNSLEARREEIFRGEFNKLIGGAFSDAIQYEYSVISSSNSNNWPDGVAGATARTGEGVNDLTFATNDVVERLSDRLQFSRTSNSNWSTDIDIFRGLPESDRDRSKLRYDVALGLLLDGAHPFAYDSNDHTVNHAWRAVAKQQADAGVSGYYSGNSSFTGVSEGNQKFFQFSGNKIRTDELGIPYLDSPLTKKSEVNSWPPEALLPEVRNNIISNWVLSGYSDLSMHPRNATKKEIIRKRANHDLFSSGSIFQKSIASRVNELEPFEPGWWVNNYQCLSLSAFNSSANEPALAYANTGDRYKIDWQDDKVTFEFWIKPCREQVAPGTIIQLDNSYSIALLPDITTKKNEVYSKFKIGIYSQHRSDLDNWTTNNWGTGPSYIPASDDETTASSDGSTTKGGMYITSSALNLDQWHHVVIRYGSNFNNGLLSIFVDSVSVTGGNVDGQYDDGVAARQTGIFYIDTTNSAKYTTPAGNTLFVGGWSPKGGSTAIWGDYADKQELKIESVSTDNFATGYAIKPIFQLKSELMELRVWSSCRSESELLANKYNGLSSTTGMKLYIPFLFDPRAGTPQWNRLGFSPSKENPENVTNYYEEGNFLEIKSENLDFNKTQFCSNSAYIAGMPFINVHSHLMEYVNSSYPVLARYYDISYNPAGSPKVNATAYPETNSQNPMDSTGVYANILYFQNNWESFKWLRSINSTLLPCDNPLFFPNYSLLGTNMHFETDSERLKLTGLGIASTSTEYEISRYYDDEVYSIQDTLKAIDPDGKRIKAKIEGFQTATLIAENKLEDNDYISPITTTYAVPQIYYGNRIHPESITLTFKINEQGKKITVKDLEGTLYRVDAVNGGFFAKVGHVDYGNGVLCLFSPLLVNNGIENFDLKLKGQKNLHVMQMDIPCAQGVANNSQHPRYKALKASGNANESDNNITYISTIYLHDNNLNIIGKVNLAQPVQKREEDSFIFRVKVDF